MKTADTRPSTVLTRAKLAAELGVSINTITTWSKEGMPVIYVGKVRHSVRGARTRYILERVLDWLEQR